MSFSQRMVLHLSIILFCLSYSHLMAWQTNGVAICTVGMNNQYPVIVSDGSGGAIVTWTDIYDIYSQRVDSNGATLWTSNGVAICTSSSYQLGPMVASDSAGGAIITWFNPGGSISGIYAQRISSQGSTLWTFNGVAICTATGGRENPAIVEDGNGGAIITWQDYRGPDIYTQRIDSNGSTLWQTNGVPVYTFLNDQSEQLYPQIVTDGTGGAIITWQGSHIYVQRINSNGSTLWTNNGIAICTEAYHPTIVSDGEGGAIITWEDVRNGMNMDIYAQRVDSSGSTLWMANGVAICTSQNNQTLPMIVSDGSSGAIITWYDFRDTTSNYTEGSDIYSQRVNSSGSTLWMVNGATICTAVNNQTDPVIVSDGVGGAIIAWLDTQRDPLGNYDDLYAQHVNSNGSTLWTNTGIPICIADYEQLNPTITQDGEGGAIMTWGDGRNYSTNMGIYVAQVNGNGLVPVEDWMLYASPPIHKLE